MNKLLKALLVVFTVAGCSLAADDIVVNITRAELTCAFKPVGENRVLSASKIELVFDKSTRSILQDLDVTGNCNVSAEEKCKPYQAAFIWLNHFFGKSTNYYTIQLGDGVRSDLTDDPTGPEPTFQNTLRFLVDGSYNIAQPHLLIAKTINSGKAVPFMIKVEPNSSCELVKSKLPVPTESKPDEKPKINTVNDLVAKPAAKDNPALKVDFSLLGAKRNKSVYSINLNFRSEQRRRLGFAGYYDLTYFFFDTNVRINAKANDKKNVLNIGAFKINHNRVFHDDGNHDPEIDTSEWRFPGLSTSITPRIETEWGFDELSYVIDLRETLPINLYQSRGHIFQLNPFIGFEGGYKHLTKDATPGWRIARPLAGAGLTINLFRKGDKARLAFQADYIRRFFLHPELSYGYNDAGKETADRTTKRPRDQFKSKLIFNAGLFSPFIEYEYGRVPPKYTLVNSSFKTGIQFDVDVVWKNIF